MLRNPARFALYGLFMKQSIKKRCLSVVDMTHHRYHWWPKHRMVRKLSPVIRNLRRGILFLKPHPLYPKFINNNRSGIKIKALINRRDNSLFKKLSNQRCHRKPERLRELINCNRTSNLYYFLLHFYASPFHLQFY